VSHHWRLELGQEVVALLEGDSIETPWMYCRIAQRGSFDRYRAYFADEETWPDSEAFDALCAEIAARGRFILRDMETGERYGSVVLNCEDDVVWFRYGDQLRD
jgi:hypothetical protein